MLNDDNFKEIEDFLKIDGNSELHRFQQFEKMVIDFFSEKLNVNTKEGFLRLNQLMTEVHAEFNKNNKNCIKDFATTIIILKHLLLKIQNIENSDFLPEKDKEIYIVLIKLVVTSLQEEADYNLSFYKIYSEYLEETKKLLNDNL